MKCALLAIAVMTGPLMAASPSDAEIIKEATSPLPGHLQSGARVAIADAEGGERVLQEGSNGFVCFPDAPEDGFAVACVEESLLPFLGQVPTLAMDKDSASVRLKQVEAGIKDGSIKPPAPGSRGYVLSGPERERSRLTMAIFLPGATAESTGLPTKRSDGTWIMCPGTPDAHIMVGDMPYGRPDEHWRFCGR